MSEEVLVAGAGIAGLGVALALGDSRRVTLIDRDPPAPQGDTEDAFLHWERRGATQLRHSHVFLGRLTRLLEMRYPELLRDLVDAGARIFTFEDGLPPPLRAGYVKKPGDEELSILFSRRTTLELVMRRYVARMGNVRILTDTAVRGIVVADGAARGLAVGDAGETLRADLIVDASGRNTAFPDWLRAQGLSVREETSPAGILYFTRHYRMNDGAQEPVRDGTPGAGDLGYIKYGVFPADNRHFSVTLAVPEIENELRTAVMRPEIFDAICSQIPGTARWTDAARAAPASKGFAMGNLVSVWRSTVDAGVPQLLNFFAVGDAAVRTNPLYGRGCSAGVVHAHVLRQCLNASANPRTRALLFEAETRKALRPYFDSMVRQDRQAIRRAEAERDPHHAPSFRARAIKSLIEDAVGPAARGDIESLRAFSRAFHMVDVPDLWWRDPGQVARLLRFWSMPKSIKRARGFYPPKFGPDRAAMLSHLKLAS